MWGGSKKDSIVDRFGGNKEFEIGRHHHEIKDIFCSENNIPLLRIPYIYDADDDKEEIETIIKDFIEYNIVPQKIREFYESENRYSYIELLSKMNS